MSDANLANPREALGDDGVTVTRGVLIDVVEGNCEFAYRRYAATWLMVTSFDDPWNYDRGDEYIDAALNYVVEFEPMPA